MDQNKPYELKDLEKFYAEDEGVDRSIFAEMRSNILLYAGEHYNKKDSNFFRRIRNANDIPDDQKIRLTKNHIQKICKVYANHISTAAPGVGFRPKNETELPDQKAAELHHAVWRHISQVYNLDDMRETEIDDLVQIGEVACKIFYDVNQGPLMGYEPLVDEQGQPVVDPMTGEPQQDESKPVYRGKFVFEKVYGFNLLRPSECTDLKQAERLTIRKMVSTELVEAMFPDKAEKIKDSPNETFLIFDPSQAGYRQTEHETLIKETYFKPCPRYPQGYFYIYTKDQILREGELPGGLFPIVVQEFDKFPTTARGRSPIKTMRPYQVEINRSASKMAEHQITLGDDKILLVNGSKITAGASLPGVRTANVTGQEPVIMQGRDGSQYLQYMSQTTDELYKVMMVDELPIKSDNQIDPFGMLFIAASKKVAFSRYIKRFEQYLIAKTKLTLSLAKLFLPDDEVVQAIGKSEQVNIKEFKNSSDMNYEIYVEAQSEDIETKLGRQMAINQVIQYVGNKLEKEDIGRLMRNMPYGNFEKSFDDWTLSPDSATNVILALDRGEQPIINEYDDPVYMIKRLVLRMGQADFKLLPQNIQMGYQKTKQIYEQIQVENVAKVQRAQQGFIPTDGLMVVCDLYVADPANPAKSRRARLPYSSLAWLINQLEVQGTTLADLENMNQRALGEMGDMLQAKQGGSANGMAVPPQKSGNEMPGRDSMYGKLNQLHRSQSGNASRGQPGPGPRQPGPGVSVSAGSLPIR